MKIIESNFNFGPLSKRNSTNKIITHHADAVNCTVLDINQWHKANGWSGIGYNFFIRKDGSVYAGRPIDTIGAHTLGQNSDSIGICLEGKLTQEKPTAEQIASLKELINYIKRIYGNIPVKGHKDFMSTDCPGSLMDYLGELNDNSNCSGGVCSIPVQNQTVDNTVLNIQRTLNRLKIASLDEDGIIGNMTRGAIVKFQGICGINQDGIWGNQTQNCADQILSKPLCGIPYVQRIPSRYIQWRLGIGIDGIFGNGTAAAVKSWQSNNGLAADGIVGNMSWLKLIV